MAATPTTTNNNNASTNINSEVSRQEIQAAIAKAVELRALHAALMQGHSPSTAPNPNFPSSSSPLSHHSHQFSAQDYPVFTPSYEDDPLPGYRQIRSDNRNYGESWEEYGLGVGVGVGVGGGGGGGGGGNGEDNLSDYRKANASSRNRFLPNSVDLESHTCPADDQKSATGSTANHITVFRASPGANTISKTRRNSMGDLNSVSSCNKCHPATIQSEIDFGGTKSGKSSNVVFPLTDSHSSVHPHPKNKGLNLSWLFPRLKKKNNKSENSPNRTESEEVSHVLQDASVVSVESMKKQLLEANESRDAALSQVSEMKSSLGDLREKLEYLENYCEELKKALRQAVPEKSSQLATEKLRKAMEGDGDHAMPVSEEVLVEGFLQIVSEARLSVKQFCKTLVGQVEETDKMLVDNLNSLLQPYKLSLNSKYSKAVLYHLEAIVNQILYQDFENCVFQKNGWPKHLDPHQERQAQFSSFVALRNLSWNEVLRKGTKYYSEEFSKFCDQKMNGIITTLCWTRPWAEQLLQAFFVAAKCIWLLHLLAFSFSPPIGILRVGENRTFDGNYMEDIFVDKQRSQGPSRVKLMVMPGFYVHDRVLRCKVLCRYKSVP